MSRLATRKLFSRLTSTRSGNLRLEILVIVIGINIALWFEGVFDDLNEAETEQHFQLGEESS